jgi:EAL domain-containing protein (putative c-di-GMP-specific phosphodiesterase class I)
MTLQIPHLPLKGKKAPVASDACALDCGAGPMNLDLLMVLERATVHYQPIVDLNTGAVAGFEALLRIVDADGKAGSIGPFIEQIESDSVLLERLMRRLLGMIRRDTVPLFERYPGFYVSVNVPPAILGARTALGEPTIRGMLVELDLIPYQDRLVCEITERQALSAQGRAALELGRQNRIRLAVDDFGTGHSGIAQMLGLTIDVLKLDRSQVVLLTKDETAERLVRGIIAAASLVRARVVAEGVESAAQAFFLQAAGVDYGQGWFWSPALPAAEMPEVLEAGFPNWRRDLIERLNAAR